MTKATDSKVQPFMVKCEYCDVQEQVVPIRWGYMDQFNKIESMCCTECSREMWQWWVENKKAGEFLPVKADWDKWMLARK